MKGVFAVKGNPNRFIFQGVHMLLDAANGGPWGNKPRRTIYVLIFSCLLALGMGWLSQRTPLSRDTITA